MLKSTNQPHTFSRRLGLRSRTLLPECYCSKLQGMQRTPHLAFWLMILAALLRKLHTVPAPRVPYVASRDHPILTVQVGGHWRHSGLRPPPWQPGALGKRLGFVYRFYVTMGADDAILLKISAYKKR